MSKFNVKYKCLQCFDDKFFLCGACDGQGGYPCQCQHCKKDQLPLCKQKHKGFRGKCLKCKGKAMFSCQQCNSSPKPRRPYYLTSKLE